MTRIRRVLFASDFSKASNRAFATALALTRSTRARLTIVHVITPIIPMAPEQHVDPVVLERIDREMRRWSRRRLDMLGERARRSRIRAALLMREGDPADQIVRAARSTRADLLVMGTHGRRGFSKLFLGSVAQRVASTAPCPVITVKSR